MMKARQLIATLTTVVAMSNLACDGTAYPSQIAVDRSNRIFICNDDGLKIFDAKSGLLEASQKPLDVMTSLCPFAVSGDGSIYVTPSAAGAERGLQVYGETSHGTVERVGSLRPTSPADDYLAGFGIPAKGIVMTARPGGKALDRYQITDGGNLRLVTTVSGPRTQLTHPVVLASGAGGLTCAANMGEDGGPTTIACFNDRASGNVKPTRMLTGPHTRLANINALAIADDGSIIAACLGPDRLLVFAPGAGGDATPSKVIEGGYSGLSDPSGVAIDSSGGIYAANPPPKTITYYRRDKRGNTKPTYTITEAGTESDSPFSAAVSRDGSLYVDDKPRIFVFSTHPNAPPTLRTTLDTECTSFTGVCGQGSLALDRDGHLYVSSGLNVISVYDIELHAKPREIGSYVVPLSDVSPQYVAANENGEVFVAGVSGDILSFGRKALGGVRPRRVGFLKTASDSIRSMSVDTKGTVYFPDEMHNVVYVLSTDAFEGSPLRSIAGPETRLARPRSVAVDRRGDIFVANYGSNEITVFAPGSTGNAVPASTISGWRTRLDHPTGVAIGKTGHVYVVNGATDVSGWGASTRTATITVFEAGATGNASPVEVIPFDQSVMYTSQ